MTQQLLPCPNGGKCGSATHLTNSQAYRNCLSASMNSGRKTPHINFAPTPPGNFRNAPLTAEEEEELSEEWLSPQEADEQARYWSGSDISFSDERPLQDEDIPLSPEEEEELAAGCTATTQREIRTLESEGMATTFKELLRSTRRNPDLLFNALQLQAAHRETLGRVWRWAGEWRDAERAELEANGGEGKLSVLSRVYEILDNTRKRIESKAGTVEEEAVRNHVSMMELHPFVKRNDRLSRMWANLIVMTYDSSKHLTWAQESIPDVRERKERYDRAMEIARTTGNITPLVEYANLP